ncbi:hypothetical protein HETIRDRAFT_411996, partial [Heterobasidion irregulare TC 32-1]
MFLNSASAGSARVTALRSASNRSPMVLEIATLFVADGLNLWDRDLREELRAKVFNLGRKAIIERRPSKVVHLDCDVGRRRIERGRCAVRRERHLPKAPPQGL